jgi:pyruvate formate lyase activating enzyme
MFSSLHGEEGALATQAPPNDQQVPGAEPSGLIFNIMRFAVHDGPGIRTTVFFKGCPLSCRWCHNPESQSFGASLMYFPERCRLCGDCMVACPHGAIRRVDNIVTVSDACRLCGTCAEICRTEARQLAGRRMGISEVMAEIERDVVFFDESGGGVTFSGGEPLAQPQFLGALLSACRERGIHTTLETCGFAQRAVLLRLSEQVDLILYDLKIVDPAKHEMFTGAPSTPILRNLEALAEAGRPVTVRIPIIPGINDGEAEVSAFRDFLAPLGIRRIDLLPYHRTGAEKYRRLGLPYMLPDVPSPSSDRMWQVAVSLEAAGFEVKIGGSRGEP